MNDIREYRKQLLLHCLHLESPLSISELAEHMEFTAKEGLHPRLCWDGMTPAHVASLVKELVIGRHVSQSPKQFRSVYGKLEPRWELAMKCDVRPLPRPPVGAFERPMPVQRERIREGQDTSERESNDVDVVLRLDDERARSLRRIAEGLIELLSQYDRKRNIPSKPTSEA